MVHYCKQRFPGKGSDTLPAGAKLLLHIITYVLNTKVHHNFKLNGYTRVSKNRWFI